VWWRAPSPASTRDAAFAMFGAAPLKVHIHSLVVDGVFSQPGPGAPPGISSPAGNPPMRRRRRSWRRSTPGCSVFFVDAGRLPEAPGPTDPVAA